MKTLMMIFATLTLVVTQTPARADDITAESAIGSPKDLESTRVNSITKYRLKYLAISNRYQFILDSNHCTPQGLCTAMAVSVRTVKLARKGEIDFQSCGQVGARKGGNCYVARYELLSEKKVVAELEVRAEESAADYGFNRRYYTLISPEGERVKLNLSTVTQPEEASEEEVTSGDAQ